MIRRDGWITGLGSAATILIVTLAWAATTNHFPVLPAFAATLATIALTAVSLRARFAIVRSVDDLHRATARAEAVRSELDEQRRSVDALADGLDGALFICDPNALVHYANHKAMDLFRSTEPIGRSLLAVTLSYDLEQFLKNTVRSGELGVRELTFNYPEERIAIVKAWRVGDEPGRMFLSVFDVTDLRRLERIRQDFVANVSHELRTPMTLIRAMSETLLDEATSEDVLANRYLPQIISEVDRLSTITQDLLTLGAAESNAPQKQTCDLAEIVKETTEQLVLRADEKGLGLSYEGPDSLIAEVNDAQMTQVAINLVENAIKYTQSGSVEVRLWREGREAVFQVQDTGIGVASEHQRRIFERFYRVDKGRSRASGGTGLGLSIVKHIVEAHGGTVSLESSLNQGSIFTARIPLGAPITG